MVSVQPGQLWGRGQRKGRGHGPQGRRQVRAWRWGGVWVSAAPLRVPHLATAHRGIWCRVDSPESGTGAAGRAGLSRGPRGGRAVHSRRAGRSPRSPCLAAPAVGPVAGGQPSACGASPATAPASRKRAWGDRQGNGGFGLCWGPPHPKPPTHSPLLRVQITAAHSNGEEAWGAVWGAVAVQEASHIEAKIHGARQVVWVSVHPPDDLSSTKPSSYPGPLGLGTTQVGSRAGHTRAWRPLDHHTPGNAGGCGQPRSQSLPGLGPLQTSACSLGV